MVSVKVRTSKGKNPGRPSLDKDKLGSALKLIETGISPTKVSN